jgi:hypothetical protein
MQNAGDAPRSSSLAVAQFASLEPSWAGVKSGAQLRGLLIFGALFNRRLYVHDTQLADNSLLLNEYEMRHDNLDNLYGLLAALMEGGVVVTALRHSTFFPKTGEVVRCQDLSDLLSTWKRRDPSAAWVTPPAQGNRAQLLGDLDRILSAGAPLVRYDYLRIKKDFMSQVHDAAASPDGQLRRMLSKLPIIVRNDYESILNRDWFSHSDTFGVLRLAGVPLAHPLIQMHGMFDEAAYARWHRARLLGCDWSNEGGLQPEQMLGNDAGLIGENLEDFTKVASGIVEGPGVELLGTLTSEEILGLREKATELFQLQELVQYRGDQSQDLDEGIADASVAYWEEICSYLRRSRPRLALGRTKVGIFLRRKLPRLSQFAERMVRTGLTTLAEVSIENLPVLKNLDSRKRAKVTRLISLEFVFFTDGDRLRALKRSFPSRSWVTVDARSRP